MVMEYMEHDLKDCMDRKMKHPFSISEVKQLMLQLLRGTGFLHKNWILHRDLKTSNILYNNKGQLKARNRAAGLLIAALAPLAACECCARFSMPPRPTPPPPDLRLWLGPPICKGSERPNRLCRPNIHKQCGDALVPCAGAAPR